MSTTRGIIVVTLRSGAINPILPKKVVNLSKLMHTVKISRLTGSKTHSHTANVLCSAVSKQRSQFNRRDDRIP